MSETGGHRKNIACRMFTIALRNFLTFQKQPEIEIKFSNTVNAKKVERKF